jgi:NADH-quinone oxidoreductase subunit L
MGGLSKKMPITYLTFVFGWLAIIGTPLFSGFFSKDEILWKTYASPMGSKALWIVGVIGATCTAFYMTRLMALTFWGKSRVDSSVHVHESPPVMTVPLMVLAALSLVGGWIGIPHLLGEWAHIPNVFEGWLHHSVTDVPVHGTHGEEWLTMGASVMFAGLSAYAAYHLYIKKQDVMARLATQLRQLHRLVYNKYFVDEIYQGLIVGPIVQISRVLWAFVDVKIVDRTTYFLTDVVRGTGSNIRLMVNGNMQQYALYIVFGIVVSLVVVLAR